MTSQRFSNDKTDIKDFLRCLKKSYIYPVIALLVLCFTYLKPTIDYVDAIKKNPQLLASLKINKVISMFGVAETQSLFGGTEFMAMGMVLCGLIMALSLFSFVFKKNSVNVYFSMGITRARLYLNRLAAATVELFVASFLPFFITFAVNASFFGFHFHQVAVMLYLTAAMFISGLAGLTIGAFAMAVSGSGAEMVITALATSSLGSLAIDIFDNMKFAFLKGYVSNVNSLSKKINLIFSPWSFVCNLTESGKMYDYYSPITYMARLLSGDKVPTGYKVSLGLVLPLVIWTLISAFFAAIGFLLFKKRKNENAHSFGKFTVSRAVNGLFGLLVGANILLPLCTPLHNTSIPSVFICVLIFILGTALVFLLTELVIIRKFKKALRMFTVYGGFAAVMAVLMLVIGTGYFGTFNKLPEISEIKSVSMSYKDPLGVFDYDPVNYYEFYGDIMDDYLCKSSKESDIKLCCEYFDKVKSDKAVGDAVKEISFVIQTKDGKNIIRRFIVYSNDLANSYSRAVFGSDYFTEILKSVLNDNNVYSTEEFFDITPNLEEFYLLDGTLVCDDVTNYSIDYSDSDYSDSEGVTAISKEDPENADLGAAKTIYATEKLKTALLNDLKKINYDEYYGNKSLPVYGIALYLNSADCEDDSYNTSYGYFEYNPKEIHLTSYAQSVIMVYPEMTETVAVLEQYDVLPMTKSVKAVLCPAEKLSLKTIVCKKSSALNYSILNIGENDDIFYCGSYGYGIEWMYEDPIFDAYPEGTFIQLYERLYESEGVSLVRINNPEKAQKIADASRTVYNTGGDNGRFIYVIYEDGSIVGKYLPESELSVLN